VGVAVTISRIPAQAIRGASSDVLPMATLARMQETGAQAFIVPGSGHAPALMEQAQIAAVRRFLEGADQARPRSGGRGSADAPALRYVVGL
jgi:pimeloyl-ACP methyl ester carboxylesterase